MGLMWTLPLTSSQTRKECSASLNATAWEPGTREELDMSNDFTSHFSADDAALVLIDVLNKNGTLSERLQQCLRVAFHPGR
jgi:hypothetical protein